MIEIPAGEFQMGDLSGAGTDAELPIHSVAIGAFRLSKHEISFRAWHACVDAEGCTHQPDPGLGRDEKPVVNVSWDDAHTFINWLNRETGRRFRLPSEAEWEYAARAGTGTAYPWGERASHEYANYGTDDCCDGLALGRDQWVNTSPVGSFPANPWGGFTICMAMSGSGPRTVGTEITKALRRTVRPGPRRKVIAVRLLPAADPSMSSRKL